MQGLEGIPGACKPRRDEGCWLQAGWNPPSILSKVFPQLEFTPYSELLGKVSGAILSCRLWASIGQVHLYNREKCHMVLNNNSYLPFHQKNGWLLILRFLRKKFCLPMHPQPSLVSSSWAALTLFKHFSNCEFGYLNAAKLLNILH